MYKNNQGQIEVHSVSKGTDGKEGYVSHLTQPVLEAWFRGSGKEA